MNNGQRYIAFFGLQVGNILKLKEGWRPYKKIGPTSFQFVLIPENSCVTVVELSAIKRSERLGCLRSIAVLYDNTIFRGEISHISFKEYFEVIS